jgi:ABC-type multidrug transport system permease subunit
MRTNKDDYIPAWVYILLIVLMSFFWVYIVPKFWPELIYYMMIA